MVRGAIAKWALPIDRHKGIYLVLTAEDVGVDRFCVGSCGYHETLAISNHSRVMFGWIGNARKQCVGECAWPFGVGPYGPPSAPLGAPNGDVGIDGMIINIATILAGTATNPFNNGYFQGDRLAPLEAVTACAGIFGPGAYPGYPGEVLVDPKSNVSFNAYGVTNRRYMLPAMWSPSVRSCRTTMG
ncbi:protein EXORDIUM-like 2 [Magnolia sinica]|uniref:protein EXORDIUM-like 2 n=1 Tax=Magnolia sinica TaxID=86752 RepID=UPI00265895CC|nr:protein EXORDIUM-like 2 [Magnolia sinica]